VLLVFMTALKSANHAEWHYPLRAVAIPDAFRRSPAPVDPSDLATQVAGRDSRHTTAAPVQECSRLKILPADLNDAALFDVPKIRPTM
jgi:hypothetical protein